MSHSTLDLIRQNSLTRVLVDEIQKLISSGEIHPGERINESGLAQRFAVSRGPVREALQSLGAMGWLTFTKNRGAFVRTFTLEEAIDLYELRRALDEMIARRLAVSLTDEQALELEGLLRQLDDLTQRQDVQAYYQANLAFHDRLAVLAGNTRALTIYRGLVGELHLIRRQTLATGGGLAVSNSEHWDLYRAIRTKDPHVAAQAAHRHIEAALARLRSSLRQGQTAQDGAAGSTGK